MKLTVEIDRGIRGALLSWETGDAEYPTSIPIGVHWSFVDLPLVGRVLVVHGSQVAVAECEKVVAAYLDAPLEPSP